MSLSRQWSEDRKDVIDQIDHLSKDQARKEDDMKDPGNYHPPLPRQRTQPQIDREEPLIADRSGFNLRLGRFDMSGVVTNGGLRALLLGLLLLVNTISLIKPKTPDEVTSAPGGVSVQLPALVTEQLKQMGTALEQINSKLDERGLNSRRVLTGNRKPKAKPEAVPTPFPEPFSRNRWADNPYPMHEREFGKWPLNTSPELR